MSNILISAERNFIQIKEHISYSSDGVVSKVIWKNDFSQKSLFCLAATTEISEHTSTRDATLQVIEGTGVLTLNDKNIALETGIFIFMPANAPHALKADSNLAFILTLSAVT